MREGRRAREPLCSDHPLDGREVDTFGRTRIRAQQGAPATRSLEREGIRRVGGDFTAPDCRNDAMLMDRRDSRMRTERDDGRQFDHLEPLGKRPEQRVLDPTDGVERNGRGPDESVRFVAPHQCGSIDPGRLATHDLEQQCGEVGSGDMVTEPRQDLRRGLREDPSKGAIHVDVVE